MVETVPLYEQIKQALTDEIDAGGFDHAVPFVTQRQVCERFGVSTITAVRALNDLVAAGLLVRRRGQGTFVAEPERRRVPEAGGAIALIVNGLHGLRGNHLANILITAEAVCAEQGYQLVLSNSAESAEREEVALRRALDQGVRGILLYPVQGRLHPEALTEVRRRRVPLVMIDRYRPDVPTDAVVADNSDLAHRLTTQLIERGHERIATLWGETECTSVVERQTGHVQALREHGLAIRPDLTLLRPYEPLAGKPRLAMLSSLLQSAEPPTVLLCANGYVLAQVAEDLAALGRPDLELACMDDSGPPYLTSVEGTLPSAEMARQAMELLLRRITSSRPYAAAPRHVVVPVEAREASGVR
ncbi:GntR family transcriptional regulator [Kribbella sp. NBC_01505]